MLGKESKHILPVAFTLMIFALILFWARDRETVSVSNPRVSPFMAAAAAVDRAALGFGPLPQDGKVRIEIGNRPEYDVMLHYYGVANRTIAFRKTSDGNYKWIAEQEVHRGPNKFIRDETETYEFIVIEYQFEPVNGIPINQLDISYEGEDSMLAGRTNLTLDIVRPIIKEWSNRKAP